MASVNAGRASTFCTCVADRSSVPSVSEGRDYARLYQGSAPALWRALYGFTGGRRQVAEDALAEAFARAMERGASVRDPLPYIYRTAFRLASAELRLDRRRGLLPTERVAIEAPDLVDLIRALEALPAKQRAVVILHDEEGYSAAEVARLIGIAPPTVRVHLHRGRKRLRALLGSEEDEDHE
jgi:RNA polymerase sigma factor (sigma-70 family)